MYVTVGGLWKKINNGYITIGGVWKKINAGYVTIGGVWKKFFSAEPIPSISTYPKVRNSGGTDINNTTVKSNTGDVLYGYRGSWLNNPTSYENKWQWSAYSGGPYSDFSPSQTATTLSTAGNINTWDKRYIVYVVRATNATGTSSWVTSSNEAHLVKWTPGNSTISISGTATIGQTLIALSTWETTLIYAGDWTPDTYLYEWIYGDTGSAAFNSTNSSNYTITSEDAGHTIKVKITATNSGGSTAATSAATATITIAKPVNSTVPTFILKSGTAGKVGAVYTLNAGSWTNTPTSYTYYLDRNNAGGTNVLSLNQTGATYDWTVGGTYGGNTLSFSVSATNAGGTSSAVYSATNLGPFTYLAPTVSTNPSLSGTGEYNTGITYDAGTYTNAASITTQLIVSTSTTFSSTTTAKAGPSPYTVTSADVAGTPYKFAVRDTVVGLDGTTYYFYSGGFSGASTTIDATGYILSYKSTGLTPTLSASSSAIGGFTTGLTNYDSNYTFSVATSAGSVSPTTLTSNATITVSGLSSGASATVTVTSSRSGYTSVDATRSGTATTLVAPSGGAASISGTTTVGQTLTLNRTAATGTPTPTATWIWQRNSGGVGGNTYQTVQTNGDTYPLTSYDANYNLRVIVTWTNGVGSDQVVTTAATNAITPLYWIVSYNANGGSGTIASTSIVQGGTGNVTASTPTPPSGKVFSSWNTAAGGSGTSYASNAVITPTADTPLYAQYTTPFVTPTCVAPSLNFLRTSGSSRLEWYCDYPTPSGSVGSITGMEFSITTGSGGTGTVLVSSGSRAYPGAGTYPYSAAGTVWAFRMGTPNGDIAYSANARYGRARVVMLGTNGTTYNGTWSAWI